MNKKPDFIHFEGKKLDFDDVENHLWENPDFAGLLVEIIEGNTPMYGTVGFKLHGLVMKALETQAHKMELLDENQTN